MNWTSNRIAVVAFVSSIRLLEILPLPTSKNYTLQVDYRCLWKHFAWEVQHWILLYTPRDTISTNGDRAF